MGTASTAPPSLKDEKSSNPGLDFVKPMDDGDQDGKVMKENLEKSVFVNSEPMREEQVQNAVKFLSHPKVKGSPVIYRRSFLEKKGLTKEEIDEAFRRVPDPPSNVTSAPEAISSPGDQLPSATNLQSQVPGPIQKPTVIPTSGGPTVATLQQSRFHWTHAFVAMGLLAASGAGTAVLVKNAVVPRLKSWIRKVVSEEDDSEKGQLRPSPAEEAVAAAKAAAVAAADVAKASQEMLTSKNEERKYFEAFTKLLDLQVEEMKSMRSTLHKLESKREVSESSDKLIKDQVRFASENGSTNKSWRNIPLADQVDPRQSPIVPKQAKVNGTQDFDLGSVARPSSLPASMEPAVAPHPKSYMEIMSMLQRGEKPPGIKDIDDKPPNPNQPPSNPRLIPRSKPWETGQIQASSIYGTQSQVGGEVSNSEIDENGSSSLSNGKSSGSTGEHSEPWWQYKTVKVAEIEHEPNDMAVDGRPAQRAWVPPKPPTVAIPEAAAAIRQPKSLVQEQSVDYGNEIQKSSTANEDLRAEAETSNDVLEAKISNGVLESNPGDGEEEQEGVSEEFKY